MIFHIDCKTYVCMYKYLHMCMQVQIIEFEEERNQKEMYEAVVHFYEILGSGNQSCDNPYSSSGQRILNSNVDNTYECATELDDIDHIYDYISFIPNMVRKVLYTVRIGPLLVMI